MRGSSGFLHLELWEPTERIEGRTVGVRKDEGHEEENTKNIYLGMCLHHCNNNNGHSYRYKDDQFQMAPSKDRAGYKSLTWIPENFEKTWWAS